MAKELDFHDGFVDGVLLSERNVRLLLRSEAGQKSTLELIAVEAFRATDMREGNIIFDLKLLSPDELSADFVLETYDYSDELKEGFTLRDWVNSAKRKGLTALDLTPSYGCSISAVFKDYRFIDENPR